MSFEALILNNVEVMGYNHQNNFFGEKSFHYSTTKTLSIRGYVLDLTNTVGARDIFIDVNNIKNISKNFQNVIINGVNFGVGKFVSLSFDNGTWVRSTQFNADIEIYQTASLQTLTSKEFSNSNYYIPNGNGPIPNIVGFKFYKTTLKYNNRPVYYDTTHAYALWSYASTWRITEIKNVGLDNTDRFTATTSSNPNIPTIGMYTNASPIGGGGTFAGTLTLNYDGTQIDISSKRFDLIKNFSENFELNFDNNSKILGGNHSIDIEYNADNKDLNVIALAQSLALELLNKNIPADLTEGNYLIRPENSYKVLRSESYDIINGKCGFTKQFSYSTDNNLSPYSINRNLNIDVETNGIVTVGESCDIKGENDVPSLYDNALIGLNKELAGVYARCNSLFSSYSNKLNITGNLNSGFLQKNIKINKFDGTINYDINFNNDKKNLNPYIFDYTTTLDRDQSYILTVSEQGTIQGVGERKIINNSNTKYIVAETGWNIIKTGISSRCSGLWASTSGKASSQFNLLSKNVSRLPYQGQITYDYKYTDDPSLRNDLGDIKKLSIEFTDDGGTGSQLAPIYKEFIIPNEEYTLIQNRNLKQQATFSISAKADIALPQQNSIFNGLNYFNTLKTQVRNFYSGGYQDKYLESANFSSDEIEQNVTYEEVYKYS